MKIDFKETQYLMHQWENMLKAIPGLRTLAVKAAGEAIPGEVQSQIKSKINDTHGHVAGAQMIDVGSGGGYAAVRPRADAIIAGKRYSLGGWSAATERGTHQILSTATMMQPERTTSRESYSMRGLPCTQMRLHSKRPKKCWMISMRFSMAIMLFTKST